MSTLRGFAVGTLALIALETLSRNVGAASGALGVGTQLFRSFLSPDAPALHWSGHWPGSSAPAQSQGGGDSTAAHLQQGLGPAHATVVAGLQPYSAPGPASA